MRTIQERMAEIKAAQEAGTYTRCPRCGEHSMKLGDRLYTNALSRSYDIMICDLCGTDEAKMTFMGAPKPLRIGLAFSHSTRRISKPCLPSRRFRRSKRAHSLTA